MVISAMSSGIQMNPYFGRVMCFIDGPNFYKRLWSDYKSHVKHFLLEQFLVNQVVKNTRSLVRVHCYDSFSTPNDQPVGKDLSLTNRDVKNFQESLFQLPYFELHLPSVDLHQRPIKEKGIDARLSVDMVKYASGGVYDVAVLLSSDADFVPAVRAVKEIGCHVELVYFPASTHDTLIKSCDKRIPITAELVRQYSNQ